MKKFNVPLLITNDGAPITNASVSVAADGKIISISQTYADDAILLNGVLVPGFVNAHCHLELSHLRNTIVPCVDGMTGFIRQLLSNRFLVQSEEQLEAMKRTDSEMWEQGIVAVGDISNFNHSIPVKANSKIYYHTFIELLGLDLNKSEEIIEKGCLLVDEFKNSSTLKASITPHAPYSCPEKLLQQIFENVNKDAPLSIHMQESLDELQFCKDKSGPMFDFFKGIGISVDDFKAFGNTSPIQKLVPKFPLNKLQLVHNTFATVADIQLAEAVHQNIYWCLCVGANLFIDDVVPPVEVLYRNNCKITIGTDSLASNHQLSILEELKMIHTAFPNIPFEEMIKWSSCNGAEFLGVDEKFGKIKPGYKPGLVLLESVNIQQPKFSEEISCQRIA